MSCRLVVVVDVFVDFFLAMVVVRYRYGICWGRVVAGAGGGVMFVVFVVGDGCLMSVSILVLVWSLFLSLLLDVGVLLFDGDVVIVAVVGC